MEHRIGLICRDSYQNSTGTKQLRFARDFDGNGRRSDVAITDRTKPTFLPDLKTSLEKEKTYSTLSEPKGRLQPRFGRANELSVKNTIEDALVSGTTTKISSMIKAQQSWNKNCTDSPENFQMQVPPSSNCTMHEQDVYFGANAKASLFESANFHRHLKFRSSGEQAATTEWCRRPLNPSKPTPKTSSLDSEVLMKAETSCVEGTMQCSSISPRSRFIKQLMSSHEIDPDSRVNEHLPHISSIIIRRSVNDDEINLCYQGIGDRLGNALASCLSDLPNLRSLNIRDNRLTDISLAPILLAVHQCTNLTSLDIGSNKIDSEASATMGNLLALPECSLLDLGMSRADIDDNECCELVSQLELNQNLTALDLSHNMIGGNSKGMVVDSNVPTEGVEAIARMLMQQRGNIKSIKLSWNSICKNSAKSLGESLAMNCMLLHLDLSFNAFGDEGGLAIGGALFTNKTLRTLILSNNNIQGRAAFTIAVGCRENSSLEVLDLRSNPIGQAGGRAFLSVPAMRGDRLQLQLECCNMSIVDSAFEYDRTTQLPHEPLDVNNRYTLDLSKPHRRAVGLEVLRIVAASPGCRISACTLNGHDLSLDRRVLPTTGSNADSKGTSYHDLLEQALDHFESTWKEYDADMSGHLSAKELLRLLADLKLDSSPETLERILRTYGCNSSGLLEKDELKEFLNAAKHAAYQCAKPKPVVVVASNPNIAFKLPLSGILSIQVLFKPDIDIDVARSTSLGELLGVIDLAEKTNNRVEALHLACGQMKLHIEEAQQLVNALLRDVADVVKVLAKILPSMSSASHAQILVNLYLKDNAEERRRLEKELGPLYRPLMGYYTDHYTLDISKPAHRAALLKIAENSSLESKQRRVDRARDTSQRGNRVNFRNEKFCGKPIELRPSFFDPLPDTGVVEFDYVSVARPKNTTSAMSNKRFIGLMESLGWPLSDDSRDLTIFEYLEREHPEPKILSADEIFLFDRQIALLRGNKDVPGDTLLGSEPATRSLNGFIDNDSQLSQNSFEVNAMEPSSGFTGGTIERSLRISRMAHRLSMMPSHTSLKQRATEVIRRQRVGSSRQNEMLKVRDIIYTRWFSCRQAQWILNNCPVITSNDWLDDGESSNTGAPANGMVDNEDLKVELVVTLFSRIYDLYFFDLLLGDLSAPARAHVVHRLGWLNIFNPHRSELSYALDLREREDRLVAKMLVHMSVIEPGENVINARFSWDRCVDPVPGWALPQTWFREDGMPVKGNLKLEYFSGSNKKWADRTLRTALMDMVLASPLQSDLQSYLIKEVRNTSDYVVQSLQEGCIAECGVPIAWTYDT